MKVENLTGSSRVYTSNAYLLTGTWNAIFDKNTLVDTGRDEDIITALRNASTGVGKKRLDQVILTHTHYDHAAMLPRIREEFRPVVYGFSPAFEGIDTVLRDGRHLKVADLDAMVIHTPGHSSDSLCLYCEEGGVLFSGDTPLIIQGPGNTYEEGFLLALERIAALDVRVIYPGHGPPIMDQCNELIRRSLAQVRDHA